MRAAVRREAKAGGAARKAERCLRTLCGVKPDRRTGSPGNRAAARFFARTIGRWGWRLDTTPFDCLDHRAGPASLAAGARRFEVFTSPYSNGCDVTAELVAASTDRELARRDCAGRILLMRGALCAEQLMPKNFVFYNPERHRRIYALLEERRPAAIVTATGRNPDLVGALHPYPLIEDGDFDIPSAYCTEAVGRRIAAAGGTCRLRIDGRRLPSKAWNVVARKRPRAAEKIVVCAHIDAKEGTPGASDNAAGTVVLLLLAEMLARYDGAAGLEIVALNGEDNYSAGGQMDYLRRYGGEFDRIRAAVNVDDVGYVRGRSAYSLYGCPAAVARAARRAFGARAGIVEGEPWHQGDHMLFVQKGRPAIALTAERMRELMARFTHTPADTPAIVDCGRLVEVAEALRDFVLELGAAR
ncbi:MAG: M28 family peptidase [bacterium]|nr:M28 family peptidase [bacterium]